MALAAVNDSPTASNFCTSTLEDTHKDIDVLGASSATDIETAGQLAVVSCTAPSHGTAQVLPSPSKLVRYTPSANYHGGDSFQCTISDGQGGTVPVGVSVHVTRECWVQVV